MTRKQTDLESELLISVFPIPFRTDLLQCGSPDGSNHDRRRDWPHSHVYNALHRHETLCQVRSIGNGEEEDN